MSYLHGDSNAVVDVVPAAEQPLTHSAGGASDSR